MGAGSDVHSVLRKLRLRVILLADEPSEKASSIGSKALLGS